MRTLFAVVVISLMSLPAAAQGFSDYNGRELFMRFCASCHGADGTGDGPVADAVAATVPDLTRLARRNNGQLDEDKLGEIIDGRSVVIAHGTRYMPVWGYEFWVEEGADREAEQEVRQIIARLVDYLRALQR